MTPRAAHLPRSRPDAARSESATDGLTGDEAARRLLVHGANTVVTSAPTPLWRRILEQVRDPLLVVLMVAVVLTLVVGDVKDAAIILLVIVVNTVVGVTQGVRADGAVLALSALSAPVVRVRRDGVTRSVPAWQLVPGDVVELSEGDVVPSDGDVLEGVALLVDEAALTGESEAVEKTPRSQDTAALGEGPAAANRLSAGTVVVRGRAVVLVVATGSLSAMGRIAQLMDVAPTTTPLQRRLAELGRLLALAAAGLCLLVAVLGLLRGQPLELMAVTAISLVVAAVPESLPAVVTLSLALGAKRMAAKNAIVRRLAAVETLGSVSILATDKTGTLTEGRMVAELLWTPAGEASVTGTGYAPVGEILPASGEITGQARAAYRRLLSAAALCNDSTLQPPAEDGDPWSATGDPTEAALLAVSAKVIAGTPRTPDAIEPRSQALLVSARSDEVPFDSQRRRMTTLHEQADGRWLLICKGAPEQLLRPSVLETEPVVLCAAKTRAAELAASGYRVLAMAATELSERPIDLQEADSGLKLLGLVAISDPPRDEAAATIEACLRAGITPVLITGDHPSTAGAIARRLGILEEGDDVALGHASDEDLPDDVGQRATVYARSTPEQKLTIIQKWQAAGHVVAMTGDGVNDGPAMRRADIGIAMGDRGTEVARQAADLVLADDNLATLVPAVEEGRRVHANVRRFLLYGLAGGTAEILVMLVGPFMGLTLPLTPAQILWVNLLTHGLPGVALGAEPAESDSMQRPPRRADESILGAGLWQRLVQLGVLLGAISLGVAWWADAHGAPWQSCLFLALAAAQLGVALGVRARPRTLQNPFLIVAVVVAFALQVLAVTLAPLRSLLGTESLTPGQIVQVSAVSALGYVAARGQVVLEGRRRRARTSSGVRLSTEQQGDLAGGVPGGSSHSDEGG